MYNLYCTCSSDGKSICPECRVSWVQILPEATHFSFASGVCLSFFLSISSVIMYTYIHMLMYSVHFLTCANPVR